MPKKLKIHIPTDAEDKAITAAAQADADNPPLPDDFFEKAKRGRPELAEGEKKKRVNIMLDPDVITALSTEGGNKSALINKLLRKELGL